MNISLNDLFSNIQSFDLLCTTSSTFFSKLIRASEYLVNGTGGVYSHVALCIKGDIFPDDYNISVGDNITKIEKEKRYLLECIIGTRNEGPDIFGKYIDGVQLRDFDYVMKNYLKLQKEGKMITMAWCKIDDASRQKILSSFQDNEFKNNFVDFINKTMHKEYNFNFIDQMYVPFHNYFIVKKIKEFKDYYYGENNVTLCTEFVGNVLKKIKILSDDINVHHILPESFIPKNENETMDQDKQIPLIYGKPINIVE